METSLCPSAQADMPGSAVFGVVGSTAQEPRVGYLTQVQPVNDEILSLARPVSPTRCSASRLRAQVAHAGISVACAAGLRRGRSRCCQW